MDTIIVVLIAVVAIFALMPRTDGGGVTIKRKAVRKNGHIREILIVKTSGQEVYILLTRSGYMGVAPKAPRGGPVSWTNLRRGRAAEIDPDGEVRIKRSG